MSFTATRPHSGGFWRLNQRVKAARGMGRGRGRMESRPLLEIRERQTDFNWCLWQFVSVAAIDVWRGIALTMCYITG